MHSKTDKLPSAAEALRYPWENHPGEDQVIEVTPGVLWLRLKLPFRLNHVNIYLIEDDGWWRVLDTGLATEACQQAWQAVLAGPLAGQRLTSMIATHFHPDHMGLSAWLTEKWNCRLYMSATDFNLARLASGSFAGIDVAIVREAYDPHAARGQEVRHIVGQNAAPERVQIAQHEVHRLAPNQVQRLAPVGGREDGVAERKREQAHERDMEFRAQPLTRLRQKKTF